MKRALHVLIDEDEANSNLKRLGNGLAVLNEKEGKIISFEYSKTAYGVCLNLKVNEFDKELRWQEQSSMPIPLSKDCKIRIFYDSKSSYGNIYFDAFELYEGNKILGRGSRKGGFREE